MATESLESQEAISSAVVMLALFFQNNNASHINSYIAVMQYLKSLF